MTFIDELYKQLDGQELELIGKAKLTKTERSLFDQLVAGQPTEPDPQDLSTHAYMRKVRSALYEKSLSSLCKTAISRIDFFSEKRLYKHLMHWLRKVEKQLVKRGQHQQLHEIYLRSARVLPEGPIQDFDLAFMERMEEIFTALFPNDQVNQQLIKIYRLVMVAAIEREFPGKLSGFDLAAEILAAQDRAEALGSPVLKFWALSLRLRNSPPGESLERNRLMQQLREASIAAGSKLSRVDQALAIYEQVVFAFENSHFDAALADAERLFEEFNEVAIKRLNCSLVLCQLYILSDQLDLARLTLLRAHGIETLDEGDADERDLGFSYYLFALISLLKGEFDEAFEQIQQSKKQLEKSHFFWVNAIVKIEENAYFLMTGKAELADRLARRHIKFYNSNKDNPHAAALKSFHTMIRFCLRSWGQEVDLPQKYNAAYGTWVTGGLAPFGALLIKILEIAGVNQPTVISRREGKQSLS